VYSALFNVGVYCIKYRLSFNLLLNFLKMLRGLLCFNSLQSSLRSFRDWGLKQLRRNAYMCVNFKLEYFLTLRHNRSWADLINLALLLLLLYYNVQYINNINIYYYINKVIIIIIILIIIIIILMIIIIIIIFIFKFIIIIIIMMIITIILIIIIIMIIIMWQRKYNKYGN
jgi:hypothetical protein